MHSNDRLSRYSGRRAPVVTVGVVFPQTVSRSILDGNTHFASAKATIAIAASEYGGYSFGFVDTWPSNWLYTQDVFVVEINGVYYLCNPLYPGVNLALSFTM